MLHVSLLGEQAIIDDATGAEAVRSPRTLALVAFLASHAGVPQNRQRLASLFWPDSEAAQALTNLRRELHHLRHALGDESALVVSPRDLCWRDSPTCRVDVRTFESERAASVAAQAHDDEAAVLAHADRALAAYRGPLLPGLYEDWVLDLRAELENQCVDLCDLICRHRTRRGDLVAATAAARRRIALRPLEESGYRSLMELQADLGDRGSAVSTYHRCASVLERELGVGPDRATRATLQRLLATGSAAAPPVPGPGDLRAGPATAAFVGRSRELAALRRQWHTAATEGARIAVIRGDAGVGKTRLLTEVTEFVRVQGATVAATQCFGTSGRLALAPVAEWLRNSALRFAGLEPLWRAEVDRLVPADARRPATSTGTLADAWQRHRFFEGLARALTVGGRPTLLTLDNLQWCDPETLAFLTFCLALVPDAPLLVLATTREGTSGDGGDIEQWTAGLRAAGLLTEITLSPLEIDDTARLGEAVSGRTLAGVDRVLLQSTTGGFPLYVVEAMRAAVDREDQALPPSGLTAVLRSRLDQTGPHAREIAGLAAAVGRNFSLELLTEASDLDAGTVVQAVDELWRHRIVQETGDGYDFSHDLLRDVAYAQVSPPRRWLLHRRLAQGLELLHTADTDSVSAQLAEQYGRGGRPERAVQFYRRAARVAAERYAHEEAIRLHRAALSLVHDHQGGREGDRQELDLLESMAAPLNARFGYASPVLAQTLERSLELADRLGRTESELTALVGLWASRFVQGRTAEAHRAATRALARAGPGSELSSSAHFAYAGSALSLGRPEEALQHFEIGAREAGGTHTLTIGTRPDVHGGAWSAHADWLLGHDEAALTSCRGAVDLARTIDHPYNLAVALAYAGITHQLRDDLPSLRVTVDELRDLCDRYDFAYYREWALILDGWSRPGASGLDLMREGIDNLKAEGAFARMPYWLSLLADVWGRAGRGDAGRAVLDAALVAAQSRSDRWWLPEVMRLRAATDGPAAAVDRLRSATRLADAQGSVALLRRCEHDLAARTPRPNAARTPPS
ncbi:AAA family ATPase [Rhodococcus spelaei]|uniref:AAA family ATPase n=1 Tax=Rhodococcus spelaei TaxID=2546320 RepID=A0A541B7W3_9NOCA|nr:AAA family ATPase [Rhodococcus spelaei]TQF68416.1 AAA family ATPase [Rhodococcus spelaei]